MNQRTLKLLFLLHHSDYEWTSQEKLLSMLGGEFGQEAIFLEVKGLIRVKVGEVRPACVDNFFKLTESGKERAAKIRLRMSK